MVRICRDLQAVPSSAISPKTKAILAELALVANQLQTQQHFHFPSPSPPVLPSAITDPLLGSA